jgi:hypothetical protein
MHTSFIAALVLLAGLCFAACSDDDFGTDFGATRDSSVKVDSGTTDLSVNVDASATDLSSADGG